MTLGETRAAVEAHYRLAPWDGVSRTVEIVGHARASLAALYQKLGFRRGVEVGVWDGEHAEWLCQTNPQMELVVVDAWERFGVGSGHAEPSAFRRVHETAVEKLRPYRVTVLPLFSREAAALVGVGSQDCVFVDAAHGFDDVVQDLILWAPKVKAGGIVSGHDWETTALGWPAENGVRGAVEGYTAAHGIAPIYLLRGTSRDRWTSYFWVQP